MGPIPFVQIISSNFSRLLSLCSSDIPCPLLRFSSQPKRWLSTHLKHPKALLNSGIEGCKHERPMGIGGFSYNGLGVPLFKRGYLEMDGLQWKIPFKRMIWGYPYSRPGIPKLSHQNIWNSWMFIPPFGWQTLALPLSPNDCHHHCPLLLWWSGVIPAG